MYSIIIILYSKVTFRHFYWGQSIPGTPGYFNTEILAQSDFFGSMKDAGIFLGRKKKQRDFLGLQKKD